MRDGHRYPHVPPYRPEDDTDRVRARSLSWTRGHPVPKKTKKRRRSASAFSRSRSRSKARRRKLLGLPLSKSRSRSRRSRSRSRLKSASRSRNLDISRSRERGSFERPLSRSPRKHVSDGKRRSISRADGDTPAWMKSRRTTSLRRSTINHRSKSPSHSRQSHRSLSRRPRSASHRSGSISSTRSCSIASSIFPSFFEHDTRDGIVPNANAIPTGGGAFDEFGRFRPELMENETLRASVSRQRSYNLSGQKTKRTKRLNRREREKLERKMAENLTQNVIKAHMGVGAVSDALLNSTIFNRIMDDRDKELAERRLIELGHNPFEEGQRVITMSAHLNQGVNFARYRTKLNAPPPPKSGLKFFNSLKTEKERRAQAVIITKELDLSFYPTVRKARILQEQRDELKEMEALDKAEANQVRLSGGATIESTFEDLITKKPSPLQRTRISNSSGLIFNKVFDNEGDGDSSEDE